MEIEDKYKKVKIKVPETMTEETRDFMKCVLAELNETKVINASMRGSLLILMTMYNSYVLASREIAKSESVTMVNYRDETITHPAFSIMQKASSAILGYLKDFGLTPKSLVGMRGVGRDDEKTQLEMFGDSDFGE